MSKMGCANPSLLPSAQVPPVLCCPSPPGCHTPTPLGPDSCDGVNHIRLMVGLLACLLQGREQDLLTHVGPSQLRILQDSVAVLGLLLAPGNQITSKQNCFFPGQEGH